MADEIVSSNRQFEAEGLLLGRIASPPCQLSWVSHRVFYAGWLSWVGRLCRPIGATLGQVKLALIRSAVRTCPHWKYCREANQHSLDFNRSAPSQPIRVVWIVVAPLSANRVVWIVITPLSDDFMGCEEENEKLLDNRCIRVLYFDRETC